MKGLEQVYTETAKILKAISDPKRLRIVDMLSCGELCACKILEAFHITQPTLSHDMRVLIEAGIVMDRREGKIIFYLFNTSRNASISLSFCSGLMKQKRINRLFRKGKVEQFRIIRPLRMQ